MRSVNVEWAIGLDTLIREMAPFTLGTAVAAVAPDVAQRLRPCFPAP
jgi:hypothetical protein